MQDLKGINKMYLYKKTARPKNTVGKISALLSLVCGAALFILASGNHIALPSIAQVIGVILIGASIYIATSYLLREYTFSVCPGKKFDDEDSSYSEKYDFIITEKKNNRDIKVCHISMSDVTKVRVLDPENKKKIAEERKNMKRFTYDSEFASSRKIEVQAIIDDEEYSILVSYCDELLKILNEFSKYILSVEQDANIIRINFNLLSFDELKDYRKHY